MPSEGLGTPTSPRTALESFTLSVGTKDSALRANATAGSRERIRKPGLSAAQLAPLARLIAQQLAQEADGIGCHGPVEQLTTGER
jgi:hypothetical protein